MNILEDGDYFFDSDVYGLVESDYTYQTWTPMQSLSRDMMTDPIEFVDGYYIEFEEEQQKEMANAAFSTKCKR